MSCSVLRMLQGKIGLQYIAITSLERTKVNGYWTWQAVHAAGGVHTKLPYDCHAGLHNWHIGWSAPKKARRESWKIWGSLMKFVPMCSSRCGMLCSLWLHERPGAAAISSWAAKVQAPGFGSHKDLREFPVVEVIFASLQVNMSESFVLTSFLPLFWTSDCGPF